MSNIHSRLKEARLYAKKRDPQITQKYVADRLGVTDKAVSAWESRSRPDQERIPEIARIYGVNLLWLMNGHGNMIANDPAKEFLTNPSNYGVEDVPTHHVGEREEVRPPEILQIYDALSATGQEELLNEARRLFAKENLPSPLSGSRRA